MAVKHDPGPSGPSGEGEFALACIFISYAIASFNIINSRLKYYKQSLINNPQTDVEQSTITEEIYNDENNANDTNNIDIWIKHEEYSPTIEFRKQFIKYSSFGLITTGNYENIKSNTRAFRVFYFLSGLQWVKILLFVGVWGLLWLFLVCLGLMGVGFKLVGGKDAAKMFDIVDNPISGLMVGILATVLVQSSSTTTSLIIGLVGADEMTVNTAIPMIMGANIGTSVTNTLVSLSHFGNKDELRLGFAAATIHDCFNFLSVLVLLPVQLATHMFNHITYEMSKNVNACNEEETDCDKQEFVKPYIKPYYNDIAAYDKRVANYVSQGYCKGKCDANTATRLRAIVTNLTCDDRKCDTVDTFRPSWMDDDYLLKSSRLPGFVQIKQNTSDVIGEYMFNCLTTCDDVDSLWTVVDQHINSTNDEMFSLLKTNYSGSILQVCDDMLYGLCDKNLLKGGLFYRWDMTDTDAGILAICMSLSGICSVLYLIVNTLNILVKGSVAMWLRTSVAFNGYVSILIGMFLTIMVQSSSITTSVLTPLVAIGIIPLKDMFPLTLGANVGTTITGIISATVATSNPIAAWQVALTHLLFNIFGIMLWYPLKITRNIPLKMATFLGDQTMKHKSFPIIYTTTTFFVIPGIVYGLSTIK